MQCRITDIFVPKFQRKLARPLVSSLVSAGFPSPAEDYIEARIDLNRDLIRHPLATFYVRVGGDSMSPTILSRQLLVVDRMIETKCKDIIIAIIDNELCVKRLRVEKDGSVWLDSDNEDYAPISISEFNDFEVWGRVTHSIQSF